MPVTVGHFKNLTVGDMTGTVTVFNSAGSTTTAAATDLVRPADWNSAHSVVLSLSGTDISNAFSNAGNVTFGVNTAGYITATANAAGAGDGYNAAQFTNSTANTTMPIVWAGNSNGSGNITFGLTGSTVTGSAAGGGGAAISAGTVSQNTGTVIFSNASGVSFGLSAGTLTASVKTDYLTTARASNDAVGLNTAITNGTWTVNSSGISLNLSNHLTTARASNDAIGLNTAKTNVTWTVNSNGLSLDAGGYAGTGLSLTNATGTLNSNGLQLSVGAGGGGTVTFYPSANVDPSEATSGTFPASSINIQGNLGVNTAYGLNVGYNTAGSYLHIKHNLGLFGNNTTQSYIGPAGIQFSNGNGVSFGVDAANITNPPYVPAITASVQSVISGYAVGNTTQQSSGTLAPGSLSVQGAGLASVGVSNGSLVVSVVDPAYTISAVGNTTQTSSGTHGDGYGISGAGGVSVGYSNGTIIVSGPSAGAGAQTLNQRWQYPPGGFTGLSAFGNGSFSVQRLQVENNLQFTRVDMPVLWSVASSATANTWGCAMTVYGGLYSKNANTLSAISTASYTQSFSLASNTAGSTQMIAAAIRPLSLGIQSTLSPGEYYMGFGLSTSTSSAGTATTALGITISAMGGPSYSAPVGHVGDFTATSNTSSGLYGGGPGVYSAAFASAPPNLSLSAINHSGSYYFRGNIGLIFRNI